MGRGMSPTYCALAHGAASAAPISRVVPAISRPAAKPLSFVTGPGCEGIGSPVAGGPAFTEYAKTAAFCRRSPPGGSGPIRVWGLACRGHAQEQFNHPAGLGFGQVPGRLLAGFLFDKLVQCRFVQPGFTEPWRISSAGPGWPGSGWPPGLPGGLVGGSGAVL